MEGKAAVADLFLGEYDVAIAKSAGLLRSVSGYCDIKKGSIEAKIFIENYLHNAKGQYLYSKIEYDLEGEYLINVAMARLLIRNKAVNINCENLNTYYELILGSTKAAIELRETGIYERY